MENHIIKNIFGPIVRSTDYLFTPSGKQELINKLVLEISINTLPETIDSTISKIKLIFKATLNESMYRSLDELINRYVIPAVRMNHLYWFRFLQEKSPESVDYLKDLIGVINKDIASFSTISHTNNFIVDVINQEMTGIRKYVKDVADLAIRIAESIGKLGSFDPQKLINSIEKKLNEINTNIQKLNTLCSQKIDNINILAEKKFNYIEKLLSNCDEKKIETLDAQLRSLRCSINDLESRLTLSINDSISPLQKECSSMKEDHTKMLNRIEEIATQADDAIYNITDAVDDLTKALSKKK